MGSSSTTVRAHQPSTPQWLKPAAILLCALSTVGWSQKNIQPAAKSTQLIVVTTPTWDAVDGVLQRYQRTSTRDSWKTVGNAIPIVVGKHGLGWGLGVEPSLHIDPSDPVKHEGDGKAPAGIFSLSTSFGYASQPLAGARLPYLALTQSTDCVDDTASPHYNRILEKDPASTWKSAEHMRSTGEAYRWGVVVNHNNSVLNGPTPTPGRGSCIFLHIWKGQHAPDRGTAGCTAMPQADLEALLLWLDPRRQPLLLQLPASQYAAFLTRWKLPTTFNPEAH